MKPSRTNGSHSPASRERSAPVPANNRSSISNGSRLGIGIDCRTRAGRRWRDHYHSYLAQTGGRHPDLCRALASLLVQRELLDSALANGERVDALELVRVVGAIGRVMAQAGLTNDHAEPQDMTEHALAIMRGEASP